MRLIRKRGFVMLVHMCRESSMTNVKWLTSSPLRSFVAIRIENCGISD
jgi:hypothetical protein